MQQKFLIHIVQGRRLPAGERREGAGGIINTGTYVKKKK